jgi:sulfatase maturation enzyme AslB (radical SAM superfamily)
MNERFIYPTAAWYLTDCMLNVTDDCNLQCRYCFVQQQPHYMTLQTAKDIADWLYQNL